ncbi:MAG TPA: DUF6056 family protein [Chitinophagaceae bacterium]|nr:DUF6056 family protein [Chitinophagaceae bacterium]
MAILLAGLYVISPFLLISSYNQPVADDYFTALRDGSTRFLPVLHDSYLHWSGRYFALVIARINPLLYHSGTAYKLYPVILLVLFITTLFSLLRQVCGKYFTIKQVFAVTAALSAVYLVAMPSIPEGFYWFSSAWVYQLANIFFMFLLTLLIKLKNAGGKPAMRLFFALAFFIGVIIIGLNEISLIITCITIAGFAWFAHKRWLPSRKYFFVLTIFYFIAAAIAALAPGNFERLNHQQEYSTSWLWTFAGGLSIAGIYTLQWLAQIFIATLIYVPLWGAPLAKRMVDDGACYTVKLLKVIIFFIAVFVLLQLFTVWAAGGSNIGRIENVIYLYFLLAYFLILQLFLVQKAQNIKPATENSYSWLHKVGLLLFFVSLLETNNNVSTAWIDLLSGKASRYNSELAERAILAQNCSKDTCQVPPLTVLPKTIFFEDIKCTTDSTDLWMNQAYSQYFGKGYIVVSAPLPPQQSNMETLKNMGKEIRENIFKK